MQGSAEFSLDKYSLTFTTSNYSTAQTVTVSAAEDDDRYDNNVLKVIHTAYSGGYHGLTANLNATEDDNDNDGTLTASDATATTVLLTMSGFSGDWWYQRAGWSECLGPASSSTPYRATGLAANASSYINAYHTNKCGTNDGITQGNRFATANPTLTASDVTYNSVKLAISSEWDLDKDGSWYYGKAGACSDAIDDQLYADATGLTENTQFQYGAFRDSGCHVGVASAITFTTLLTPTGLISLAASDPSAMSVTLTMEGFGNNAWWYQRAGWSECQGPVNSSSYRARGLAPGASSYINAYRASSCGPE